MKKQKKVPTVHKEPATEPMLGKAKISTRSFEQCLNLLEEIHIDFDNVLPDHVKEKLLVALRNLDRIYGTLFCL